MTFTEEIQGILDRIQIDPNDFNLRKSHFDHQSSLHGIAHTYRVMINTLLISDRLGDKKAGLLAFCSAFIHDMARKHDGRCSKHGPDSAAFKLPAFSDLFSGYGVTPLEMDFIREAVIQHSYRERLTKDDDGYFVMAILKDADALDRCRLGDLDPYFLRLKPSHDLIARAKRNFEITGYNNDFNSFSEFIDCL